MASSVDYRLVCRTCLIAEAEFYKLDAQIFVEDDEEKISFLECLKYCTKLEDVPGYPIYICTECSTALQVAYNFVKNALEAHEILRQKLCPQTTRVNGQLGSCEEKKVSFRCKICGEKVETKKSLKEHVKLHLDMISYNCELCEYETAKRSSLNEHYIVTHGCLPTKEQLKPKAKSQGQKSYTTNEVAPTVGNQIHASQSQFSRSSQPMNVAQFLASSSSPQVTDIPLHMATVIATAPDTSSEPVTITSNLQNFGNELNLGNEMSIGNEFVIMQDGTVQEVMTNGVVINYINAGGETVALNNGVFVNDLMMQPTETLINMNDNVDIANNAMPYAMIKCAEGDALNLEAPAGNIDIDDIIVEDNIGNVITEANISSNLLVIPSTGTCTYSNAVPENSSIVTAYSTTTAVEQPFSNVGAISSNAIPLSSNTVSLSSDAVSSLSSTAVLYNNTVVSQSTVPASGNVVASSTNAATSSRIATASYSSAAANATDATNKQIRCKMCKSVFASQEWLKEHMLTHNEIPHFFCEICDFYTFFKIDLTQHYKTKHGTQPNNRQLQPKNKVNFNVPEGVKRVFVCEMCLYDTPVKAILRRHYLSKHQVEATEMQLRPIKVSPSDVDTEDETAKRSKVETVKGASTLKSSYKNALECTKCDKVFYSEAYLRDHQKQHIFEQSRKNVPPVKIGVTVTVNKGNPSGSMTESSSFRNDENVDIESLIACSELKATVIGEPSAIMEPQAASVDPQPAIMEPEVDVIQPVENPVAERNNMVPPDAIPQIVETDSIVDNILDFDFNGDAIFEDDSEENDDEEFQDLILTTDDEQEMARETSGSSANQRKQYCVQCHKNFNTHYQFENHMFVHRGLAPYRCEMCTNLYNTKRDLIRHYYAIHKNFPTRDMIQAKGDKVYVDDATEKVSMVKKSNEVHLMCAKCPYEVVDINDIKAHLSVIHGVDDDLYILQKLPFECPKCIRTFESSSRLLRHIERNHSSNMICHDPKDKNDNVACKRCGKI